MLNMVAAGCFLCIGFWIGKKVTNAIEYHGYVQGENIKKKVWPEVKKKGVPVLNSIKNKMRDTKKQFKTLRHGV